MRTLSGRDAELYVDDLDEESLVNLLVACMNALPTDVLTTALDENTPPQQKSELGETWFDIDRKE